MSDSSESPADASASPARDQDANGASAGWSFYGRGGTLFVALTLLAVLGLQVMIGLSYIGAFHVLRPHSIPIGISAPTATLAQQTLTTARAAANGVAHFEIVSGEDAARELILKRKLDAAFVLGVERDRLLVASAAGVTEKQELVQVFSEGAAQRKRGLDVVDVAPLSASDTRGISHFYMVLAWMIGGYLGATLVGMVRSYAARSRLQGTRRIGAFAIYALLSGSTLALLVWAIFGIIDGHVLAVAAVGSLIVFATACATAGIQGLLGLAGTAIILILFVAIGNPASGGPVSAHLLPGLWRELGPWLVPGAGSDALRSIPYFDSKTVTQPLAILGAWSLIGAILTLVSAHRSQSALARI